MDYGYGVAFDGYCNIPGGSVRPASTQRILQLIHMAPDYEQEALSELNLLLCDNAYTGKAISELPVNVVVEWLVQDDESYCSGIAPILRDVIAEAEGIPLVAYSTENCLDYLVLAPCLPWNTSFKVKQLTQEKLDAILHKYMSIITDDPYQIDLYSFDM